jgi:SOS response regulatory protein OraA/RecX
MEKKKEEIVEDMCRKGYDMCSIYKIMNEDEYEGEEEDEKEDIYKDDKIEV